KKTLLYLLLFPSIVAAQDYVDLLKIGYGKTFSNSFADTSENTEVTTFDVDLTYPVVLNGKNTLITGAAFNYSNLQLFPDMGYTSLYSSTLKIGLASSFNEKWSSTVVLLPKIASDYKNISGDDFYFGGFAVLKLKKKENLIYRFGIYATSEAFGIFSTPIIGWYYLSPNKRFEMDMSLPIAADINYKLDFATVGFDYYGIGRSYKLNQGALPKQYVDQSSLEFLGYFQFNALENSVLIRAKAGYASSSYEVYENGDKIDFGLSAFSFGDNRTQLNPDISGGLLLKLEAIYRFNISKTKK
ncbi:MAG: hypothetical protein ACI91R_002618, partial [Vicingaceae bacterium]